MRTRRIRHGFSRVRSSVVAVALVQTVTAGCAKGPSNGRARPIDEFAQVPRTVLNERALKAGWPFQWIKDSNGNGAVDARELAVLWGTDESVTSWMDGRELTPTFEDAYSSLVSKPATPNEERARLVEEELSTGLPTVVYTDLADASPSDQAIVRQVAEVARRLERVFMRQIGSARYVEQARKLTGRDRALFFLNQSPWCLRPATAGNPNCGAFDEVPPRVSGLYPENLQQKKDFCDALSERPDANTLFARHAAVREKDGELVAVPYSQAYPTEMGEVAKALRDLAALIQDPAEGALRDYVGAAATAFENDDWDAADRAWLKLNTQSSRWYLRVGPDHAAPLFAPCRRKALFQLSFGRFDRKTQIWKKKLALVKDKMESRLAELAGRPYRRRDVDLGIPDFVHIILNAGETRRPVGAYIAYVLPRTGPIAEAGRRRTISFTNLYSDSDSQARFDAATKGYFCPDSAWRFSSIPKPRIVNSIFHVAGLSLGPTESYRVRGQTPSEIFGGVEAAMLNQVQAQASAMHFIDWLEGRELIEPGLAERSIAFGVFWSISHLSRGIFKADGGRTVHGHVGAIMLGGLLEAGAMQWRPDMAPANGKGKGCLSVDFDRFDEPVEALLTKVARMKARGDVDALNEMLKTYVDDGPKDIFKVIQERGRQQPHTTFVYAFRTGGRS